MDIHNQKEGTAQMKKRANLAILGVLAVTVLNGCGAKQAQTPAAGHDHSSHGAQKTLAANQVQLANGDIQETTASIDVLPTFLDNANQKIKLAYATAAKNNDLLQSIPCYCGCGVSAGHLHNAHCFIKEVKQDGSVVWDDHGTRCDTCMGIAIESAQMKDKGKTTKEIRLYIDQKYREGYAKPTPTPMPS